jgi:phosphoribosyl 1,2-cyclic phosphate phosphodiesterase
LIEHASERIGLRFLGTSAGELYPGIWCRCRRCDGARRAGGRNLRQSACALLGDLTEREDSPDGIGPLLKADALIDFPPEIVSQGWRWGADFTRLRSLFVTHSHGDHFLPYLLRWRSKPRETSDDPPFEMGGPRFTELPLLTLYGNQAVESRLRAELGGDLSAYGMDFVRVAALQPFEAGRWAVTPVAANHDVGREDAVNYVFQMRGLTIYYGLDSDEPLPDTWDALSAFRFDVMIFESTYGFGNGSNHMNFERLTRTAERIRDAGMLKPNGTILATHFSPHHCPLHDETAERLSRFGIQAAYDGMDWFSE